MTGMMAQTGSLGQPLLIPLSVPGTIAGQGGVALLTLPTTSLASLPGFAATNVAGNLLKLPFAGLQGKINSQPVLFCSFSIALSSRLVNSKYLICPWKKLMCYCYCSVPFFNVFNLFYYFIFTQLQQCRRCSSHKQLPYSQCRQPCNRWPLSHPRWPVLRSPLLRRLQPSRPQPPRLFLRPTFL